MIVLIRVLVVVVVGGGGGGGVLHDGLSFSRQAAAV